MKIGFVGLGIMGKPMAKNLLKSNYELMVYDVVNEAIDEVVKCGAIGAKNLENIANASQVIILMLPNSHHVESVVLGEKGILEFAKPGTIIIDMSSISPIVSKQIALACFTKGVSMIDAPVSGGEPKAIDGTLSIMVGGQEAVFNEVYEILLHMGASAVLCGDNGAGNTTKLANQIIVALNIAAVSEAFMLAIKAGVDPTKVFDAIKGGLAGSTVMNAKIPMILEGNFEPGFKIDLHIKDLKNAIETGESVGTQLPFTNSIFEILQQLHDSGYGDKDHSGIALHYEALVGSKIRKVID